GLYTWWTFISERSSERGQCFLNQCVIQDNEVLQIRHLTNIIPFSFKLGIPDVLLSGILTFGAITERSGQVLLYA
ncbi:MAG TPA: hypothetical protein DCR43_08000, partial [Bacteroidales bacterium]|nr:hypothetical protein [Bacteroidales bacterium]